jgi:hypothetical protein
MRDNLGRKEYDQHLYSASIEFFFSWSYYTLRMDASRMRCFRPCQAHADIGFVPPCPWQTPLDLPFPLCSATSSSTLSYRRFFYPRTIIITTRCKLDWRATRMPFEYSVLKSPQWWWCRRDRSESSNSRGRKIVVGFGHELMITDRELAPPQSFIGC